MKIMLKLTREDFERLGTLSLNGRAFELLPPDKAMTDVTEVEIQFPEVSRGYLLTHDGPPLLLMPEYVPFCILESVLSFQRNNIKVTISKYIDAPES